MAVKLFHQPTPSCHASSVRASRLVRVGCEAGHGIQDDSQLGRAFLEVALCQSRQRPQVRLVPAPPRVTRMRQPQCYSLQAALDKESRARSAEQD
jgi:hypothetical protein